MSLHHPRPTYTTRYVLTSPTISFNLSFIRYCFLLLTLPLFDSHFSVHKSHQCAHISVQPRWTEECVRHWGCHMDTLCVKHSGRRWGRVCGGKWLFQCLSLAALILPMFGKRKWALCSVGMSPSPSLQCRHLRGRLINRLKIAWQTQVSLEPKVSMDILVGDKY